MRRPRLPVLAPATVVTLLAGIVVSVLLLLGFRDFEFQRTRNEFDRAAEVRFAAIAHSYKDAERALRALNLLFAASDEVTRAEFDAFALPLATVHPEARALVFHRFVRADQRAAFEAERARLRPGFQIVDPGANGVVRAGERPLYLVDDYVAPFAGNEITFGLDVWSSPPHREWTQRAIDSGQMSASPFIALVQAGRPPGIVIVMAVYRHGLSLAGVAARRAAVVGDTEVVLDLGLLVQRNFGDAGLLRQPGISITVRDPNGKQYQFGQRAAPTSGWRRWLESGPLAERRAVKLGDLQWLVTVDAAAGALPGYFGSAAIFALSLLLTWVSASYVQSRAGRLRRIEQLVEQRTGALKRASDAVRLYQRAFESSANGIILADATRPGYPVEYVNPAYERISGRAADAILGRGLVDLADEPEEPGVQEVHGALRERREGHALIRVRTPAGGYRYSEVYIAPVNTPGGETSHFVVSVYDVTTTKRYEEELERHARYDSLTGLANRVQMADRLEQAMGFSEASGDPLWVVALDLDQFRFVNDTLGHELGDELLRLVAPRIAKALPRADTAARTGGDEFVLLLSRCRDERSAVTLVREVLDALAEPVQLAGRALVVTGSAGVAAFPGDGQDVATLVKHAEIAMYRAKEAGRNTVQFYRPALTARAQERLELENALRHALARDQFELHYQPQVDLDSGDVVGMEALLRWNHPLLGQVAPDRFIGLAEETGLIVPIGAWVLRSAVMQNRAWQRAGFGPLRVAVNLSARQFAEPGLAGQVAAVLAESGLAPDSLEIEVTESSVMTDVDEAIATMKELKAMGVAMSIDDFGTGYSSLAYLKRFPVDVLKIDRSFVHDVASDPDNAAMVNAIIALARGLRMRVIAEGVETRAQLDYLRVQGCDLVQGFLYSRALPVAEFEQLLGGGGRFGPNAEAA